MTKLYLDGKFPSSSDLVSLYEYHGKAQGSTIGMKVWEQAVEDRVETGFRDTKNLKYPQVRTYPRTWLDKLDFIDRVYEEGALSDKEIVDKIVKQHVKKTTK